MTHVLDEAYQLIEELKIKMLNSTSTLTALNIYTKKLQKTFKDFANSLKENTEDFYLTFANNMEDEEMNLFCYNYLCTFILNLSHNFLDLSNNLESDATEPLDFYISNFKETNDNFIINANQLITSIERNKSDLLKRQEDYNKMSEIGEKAQIFLNHLNHKSPNNHWEIDNARAQLDKTKNSTEEALYYYKKQIKNMNQTLENFEAEFFLNFDNYDINEESRSKFTKITVSQAIKHLTNLFKNMNFFNLENFDIKIKDLEDRYSSDRQSCLKTFLKGRQLTLNKTKREEFTAYEVWKTNPDLKHSDKNNFSTVHSSFASPQKSNDNRNFIELFLKYLTVKKQKEFPEERVKTLQNELFGLEIDNAAKMQFLALNIINNGETILKEVLENQKFHNLSRVYVRKYFLQKIVYLGNLEKSYTYHIESELLDFFRFFAQEMILSIYETVDKDSEEFYHLILFLTRFYEIKNKKKIYLGENFKSNNIFFDSTRWNSLYLYLTQKYSIEKMIRYEGRSPKHTKKEKEKDTLFDRIKKIGNRTNSGDFSEANKNGINPNCKENWYMFMSKAIVAQTIEEISSYMAQIKLDPHNSTQIILQLFKTYNIKNNDVIQLVEAQQRRLIFEKNKTFFLRKGEKGKKSSLIFAFQKAIVYLDWKKDKLFEFLRISKDFQKELKPVINWLILYNYKQDADQKIKIWIEILNPKKLNINYFELKQSFNVVKKKGPQIEDLITLDVQRSFHNHHNTMNHMVLYNLLRMYAYYDPEISYCQGMNFLMGFIFNFIQDEEISFKCFTLLVQRMLRDLLDHDLKKIRLLFYQLDRLIQIYLPILYEHFQEEKIDSSLYASSWFLTLFTSSFQYTNYSYTLLSIFDIILYKGWKGFFKVILYLLKNHQTELIQMKFDQLLSYLNDLTKSEFFTNILYIEYIKNQNNDFSPNSKQKFESIKNLKSCLDLFNLTFKKLKVLEQEFFDYKNNLANIIKENNLK